MLQTKFKMQAKARSRYDSSSSYQHLANDIARPDGITPT